MFVSYIHTIAMELIGLMEMLVVWIVKEERV